MAKLQSLSVIALLFVAVFLLYDVKKESNHWENEALLGIQTIDSLQKIVYLQNLTIGSYGRAYDMFAERYPDSKYKLDSIMSVVK